MSRRRHRREPLTLESLSRKDSYVYGIIIAFFSELITGILITIGMKALHLDLLEHGRMYVICFVPSLLLMRYYAKKKDCNQTLISIVSVIFLTFVGFMWFMLKNRYIDPFIE